MMITKIVYTFGNKLCQIEVGKDKCESINIEEGFINVRDGDGCLMLKVKTNQYEAYYTPMEIPDLDFLF